MSRRAALFVRRVPGSGVVPPPPVPAEYLQLAYIEFPSTAGPYFDTGLLKGENTSNYSWDITIEMIGNVSGWMSFVFGVLGNAGRWGLSVSYVTTNDLRIDDSVVMSSWSANTKYHIERYNDGTIFVNNTQYPNITPRANTIDTLYGLIIGTAGRNRGWSLTNSRIYDFKILDTARTEVCWFIPAMRISDSVVGFYEHHSDTFITNSGTGSVSYGTL